MKRRRLRSRSRRTRTPAEVAQSGSRLIVAFKTVSRRPWGPEARRRRVRIECARARQESRPQSAADRVRAVRRVERQPRRASARHEPAGRQHGAAPDARDVRRPAVHSRGRPASRQRRARTRSSRRPGRSWRGCRRTCSRGRRSIPRRGPAPFTLALSDVGEMAFLPTRPAALAVARAACGDSRRVGRRRRSSRTSSRRARSMSRSATFRRWHRRTSVSGACRRTALRACCAPITRDRAERLSVADYIAAEHIVVREEGRSQEVVERFFERRRVRRKVADLRVALPRRAVRRRQLGSDRHRALRVAKDFARHVVRSWRWRCRRSRSRAST